MNAWDKRVPYPCKSCGYKDKETCTYYRKCGRWLSWFNREWYIIREASEQLQREGCGR